MTANPTASEQVAALRGEVEQLKLALGQLALLSFPHVRKPRRSDCQELWTVAGEVRDRVNARDEEKARQLAELDAQRQAIQEGIHA